MPCLTNSMLTLGFDNYGFPKDHVGQGLFRLRSKGLLFLGGVDSGKADSALIFAVLAWTGAVSGDVLGAGTGVAWAGGWAGAWAARIRASRKVMFGSSSDS